jgi:hypothetical protein
MQGGASLSDEQVRADATKLDETGRKLDRRAVRGGMTTRRG